jgi:hypothetical protein
MRAQQEFKEMGKEKAFAAPAAWNIDRTAKPVLMQAMPAPRSNIKLPPTVPPVFRPRQTSAAIQAKSSLPLLSRSAPTVPAVYRPPPRVTILHPQLSRVRHFKVAAPALLSGVALGRGLIQRANASFDRPAFNSAADGLKDLAKELGFEDHHLAHRMSWQQICLLLENPLVQKTDIDALMRKLLIPARAFGNVPQGDTRLYDMGCAIMDEANWQPCSEIATFLNSSIYNLRPGHPSDNMSIGGKRDVHRDETKSSNMYPEGPPTPQSSQIFDFKVSKSDRSSDMMDMSAFEDYEEDFEAMLKKSLACGKRILKKM